MEQDAAVPPSTIAVVSWQTALWTLLPLALNLWGQPSGKVLALPAKHGPILRSFPVLSLLDSISLLVTLAYTGFSLRIGLRQSIGFVLKERFDHLDDAKDYKQVLREGRRMRWLLFVCGVVEPTIKLSSMQGILWTQICGISWVFSWLLIEILSFMIPGPVPDSGTNGSVPSSEPMDLSWSEYLLRFPDRQTHIKRIHSEIQAAAIAIQFWLSLSMLQHILIVDQGFPNSVIIAVVRCVIVYFYLVLVPRSIPRMQMKLGSIPTVGTISDWWCKTSKVVLISSSIQWLLSHFERLHEYTHPWQALPINYLGSFVLLILISVTRSICRQLVRRVLKVTRNMHRWPLDLILRRRETDTTQTSPDESDGEGLWLSCLLALNFTTWVLWYAYRYNSEGTENPSWTTVFGK